MSHNIEKSGFILESEGGGQWYVCKLVGKEKQEEQLNYEILSAHYSEEKAIKKLEKMMIFNKSKKSIKVIKKVSVKRGAYKVPKAERIARTLEGIL